MARRASGLLPLLVLWCVASGPAGLCAEEAAKDGAGSPGMVQKVAGAPGKDGAAGKSKAKAKGDPARKKGGNRPAFMAKIPQAERRKLFTATEEEKMEILTKAGLTPEEIQQAKEFSERMRSGGFGGGPGGGGGGGGGGDRRFGGGGPGGDGGGSDQ